MHVTSITPRFRDTDAMGHVNNAVYLTYLEVARTQWYLQYDHSNLNFIVARVEIDFLAPIRLTSQVQVQMWTESIGNKSWIFLYSLKDQASGVEYAKAKSVQVAYDYKNQKSIPVPTEIRAALSQIKPA